MSEIERVESAELKSASTSSIPRRRDKTDNYNVNPDQTYLPVLEEAVACSSLPQPWHVEEKTLGSTRWLWVHNDACEIPEQGWKLHVSATILSAGEVLRRVLPLLLAETTAFKVAATPRQIGVLNSGSGGLSQVGKFITVYPQDNSLAVCLATALDEATAGLRGPAVPSDRPLRRGSLVHYRYGGFFHLGTQDGQGEVRLAIRTPSGELTPDERSSFYSPPDWAVDPFLEAGVAESIPASTYLVGGRYLAVNTISETPRGFIYKSIDVVGKQRCILKQGRRDGAMGLDGMDACDRLRNEARILALLAPDLRFPDIFEMFEVEGDLFLAMEEVNGESLQEYIIALAMQGRTIPAEELIAWGKELAAMLGHMHEKDLIYRDLKASNVIVAPEGWLRLIDFDVSMELPAERALYSPGTIGYMSQQQSANEAPRVVHDIYSLGALLYFMATGADPSRFPHPYDLLKRPLQWLNPELPSSMADAIHRCLETDPHARFQSMKEVADALDSVGHEAQVPAQATVRAPSRIDYLGIARRLGDTLCSFAEYDPSGQGCYWRDPRYSEIPVIARNLATGSAGPVLALAELVAELGENSHRERLRDGAHWLATQPYISDHPRPGLYNGEAGVAFALMRAGQVLKDHSLVAEAVGRGNWLAGLPFSNPGIFDGAAGRVRFHLLLWDLTGDEAHLEAAIAGGEFLLGAAIKVGSQDEETAVLTEKIVEKISGPEMLCWIMPPGNGAHDGRIYTGYALGAAGVGDALLDLFDVTNDRRFYQAAEAAVRWLESLALPALNDGTGLDWPKVEGEPLQGAFWGHGASGIGIFLLNALQHGLISRSDGLLEGAARIAARGTRWAGPTLAYGLGGPIEFLLDAYQQTSNRAYLDDAKQLAGILETFAYQQDGYLMWPSEDATLFTPDFMVGYAGIATCMLRLGMPGYVPRGMSLAASRRNRLQAVHRKLAAVGKA